MKTVDPLNACLDTIAQEHEALAEHYAQIQQALAASPGELRLAIKLLDDLIEQLKEHFTHEEQGGYYLHVVEIAPWRSPMVETLKHQHRDLLRCLIRIARSARLADESDVWAETVRQEFANFLLHTTEHEARENRLVREAYLLDLDK